MDVAGAKHGLTPLEVACPHVHVFDSPTVFNRALWLPYRRDHAPLHAAMSAVHPAAYDTSLHGPGAAAEAVDGKPLVHAIFVHADVVSDAVSGGRAVVVPGLLVRARHPCQLGCDKVTLALSLTPGLLACGCACATVPCSAAPR